MITAFDDNKNNNDENDYSYNGNNTAIQNQ